MKGANTPDSSGLVSNVPDGRVRRDFHLDRTRSNTADRRRKNRVSRPGISIYFRYSTIFDSRVVFSIHLEHLCVFRRFFWSFLFKRTRLRGVFFFFINITNYIKQVLPVLYCRSVVMSKPKLNDYRRRRLKEN